MDLNHWHIATTLPGYDFDNPDSVLSARTWPEVAELLGTQLDRAGDAASSLAYDLREAAKSARETGDTTAELETLREHLETVERASTLYTLSEQFRTGDAPLYQERPELWPERVQRLIAEHFPVSLAHNADLKVWECPKPDECELIEYDCEHCMGQIMWSNGDRKFINPHRFADECQPGKQHTPMSVD